MYNIGCTQNFALNYIWPILYMLYICKLWLYSRIEHKNNCPHISHWPSGHCFFTFGPVTQNSIKKQVSVNQILGRGCCQVSNSRCHFLLVFHFIQQTFLKVFQGWERCYNFCWSRFFWQVENSIKNQFARTRPLDMDRIQMKSFKFFFRLPLGQRHQKDDRQRFK